MIGKTTGVQAGADRRGVSPDGGPAVAWASGVAAGGTVAVLERDGAIDPRGITGRVATVATWQASGAAAVAAPPDDRWATTTQVDPDEPAGCRDDASGIVASVILPAYNESLALPHVLGALEATLGDACEIIVVDDGSTDGTAQVAERYRCRVLRQPENRGKGAAVRVGVEAASGNYVLFMDADNTYPAEALPTLIELLGEHDFVRGTRSGGKDNIPPLNRLGNAVFDGILRLVHGLDGDDQLTGLYGLRREAWDALAITADGFDLEVEIGIKARSHGLRTATFPIAYGARLGEKKLDAWRDGWRILRRVLSLRIEDVMDLRVRATRPASIRPVASDS